MPTKPEPTQRQRVALAERLPFVGRQGFVISDGPARDALVLIPAAILVGAGTGLGAVAFIWLLDRVGTLTLWTETRLGEMGGRLVLMALAGLLVGYVVDRFAPEAKGHGVPEVMEAVSLRGGRIRPRVAALKVLASAITIGTGGSAGREGPIVQTGSALGSSVGQWLKFSNERVRSMVACGAAAGVAATFNAPIAGSLFALEVILGRFTSRYFGLVVVSSVSASIVGRVFLGDKPAFSVPAYPLSHLGELLIYIVLGALAALVAVVFIRVLYLLEGLYDRLRVSLAVKAASGMVLTLLVASLLPGRQVLGPGLDLIGEAIAEDFSLPLGLLASMLVLKLLATSFTLGAGNSGGVFAPGLFMGAVLGGLVGSVGQRLFPGIVVHPGAYAIVGMAAVFSGAARAPITAVLIVFEMSNDYRLILPLMLATVISTLLAEMLSRDSIYTEKLRSKGISLQQGRDLDILQGVLVHEVMTRNTETVPAGLTLAELSAVFDRTHHHGMAVLEGEGALGVGYDQRLGARIGRGFASGDSGKSIWNPA